MVKVTDVVADEYTLELAAVAEMVQVPEPVNVMVPVVGSTVQPLVPALVTA